MDDDTQDAAEHQQMLDEQRHREENPRFSRFFKPQPRIAPDLFTTPLNWPIYDKVAKRWV